MTTQPLTAKVADGTIALAGLAAAAVADPTIGLSKLTSVLRRPAVLGAAAALTVAYALGRVNRPDE